MGGQLVLVNACLTANPLITGGQEHTHTHTHTLSRIINHAFAKAEEDTKIFMAKWDIKDGFWQMDWGAGEDYNFMYIFPQEAGKPIVLVVPTLLEMGGWNPYHTSAQLLKPEGILHRIIAMPPLEASPLINL